jgi:hypothetical protein
MFKRTLLPAIMFVVLAVLAVQFGPLGAGDTHAQAQCRAFPETGKQVCGRFLDYWTRNGGLAQQGLPLSGEFTEVSELNGQPYTVQYFERAVFEMHPENQTPYDVLLSQLGTFRFKAKYPNGEPSGGGQPQPQPQPATPAPAPAPQGIVGQTIEFPGFLGKGRLQGRVTEVQETNAIPASDFNEGVTAKGKFVVVFMTVTNPGTESNKVSSDSFKLRDSKARNFDLGDLSIMWAAEGHYGKESYYTDIQPGLAEDSVFVFDVAPDATGYLLVPKQ